MAFEEAFQQAFLYLAAALAAVLIGKRLGLGAVLGYLVVGAAIGPCGLHWVGQEGEDVTHFAEFGVVVMLFLIGLELHPPMLWRMRRQVLGLGTAQVVLSALAIGGALLAFDFGWKTSLAAGLILAMSSTAIVLQTLAEKGLMKTEAGQNSFAVLLFQDVAVIPILALLPLLGTGSHGGADGHGHGSTAWLDGLAPWLRAIVTLGAVAVIVIVARTVMRRAFHAIAKTRQREAFTGAALALVIGVALLMTKVGLSPALGAFVAGMVLANSEYRHELESDLEPFKGLLLGLFFLGVGAGIDFSFIRENLALVLGGAAALVAIKGLLLFGIGSLQGSRPAPALLFSAALAPGGEFAFVLIAAALGVGALNDEIAPAMTAIVALSMAATPLLILGAERALVRETKTTGPAREADVEDDGHPVILCGFGRFGHAVGRLLRHRGIGCTVLDHDSDQVELLRKIGIPVFYGDASRAELLEAAGARRARVLVVALRDPAVTRRIVETARREFPHLKIFLRAHSRLEAYDYLDLGEDRIYRDTLDSSLRMGVDVMRTLGVPAYAAYRAARLYRQQDEAMVRNMARHRHDQGEYYSQAREAIRSLDQLMRAERPPDQIDAAWLPPRVAKDGDNDEAA